MRSMLKSSTIIKDGLEYNYEGFEAAIKEVI